MTDIEKRLQNLEVAYLALLSFTANLAPPEDEDELIALGAAYVDSSEKLGANFDFDNLKEDPFTHKEEQRVTY